MLSSWSLRDRIHVVLGVYGVAQVLVLMFFYTSIVDTLPTHADHREHLARLNLHGSGHLHAGGEDDYGEDLMMQEFLRMREERLEQATFAVGSAGLRLQYTCDAPSQLPSSTEAVEVQLEVGGRRTVEFLLATHGRKDEASQDVASRSLWASKRFASMFEAVRRAKEAEKRVVLLHAGSGLGLHTAFFASLGAEVIAFEPFRRQQEQSCRSTQLNRQTERVRLVTAALSDHEGFGTWCTKTSNSAWTIRHGCPEAGALDADKYMVESISAVRLDSYLADNLPDLLHPAVGANLEVMLIVSASGDEEFILAGAEELLASSHVRSLWLESSMATWSVHDPSDWEQGMRAGGWAAYTDDCNEVTVATPSSSFYFSKEESPCV